MTDHPDFIHSQDPSIRGRGAPSNPIGRYDETKQEAADDGWRDYRQDTPTLKTTVSIEKPKSIINRNSSPDVPFDRSINAYRGCEHGCIYCFARPTHGYLNLSPGLDFESQLFAKPNAADLLKKELAKPSYKCKPIAMGTNTDPYQPIERDYKITRSIIELLAELKHPFTLTTKSALVLRDLDLLAPLAKENLVKVGISVTSLDHRLSRLMEPRASSPAKRLDAIEALTGAGVQVILQLAPVIPAINDMEMEQIMKAGFDKGARRAICLPVRLPYEVSPLFREWLAQHYPDRASKVMKLIQSMRGGKDNESRFGHRMVGKGPYGQLMHQRFNKLSCKLGFQSLKYDLNTDLFTPPILPGDQMKLF